MRVPDISQLGVHVLYATLSGPLITKPGDISRLHWKSSNNLQLGAELEAFFANLILISTFVAPTSIQLISSHSQVPVHAVVEHFPDGELLKYTLISNSLSFETCRVLNPSNVGPGLWIYRTDKQILYQQLKNKPYIFIRLFFIDVIEALAFLSNEKRFWFWKVKSNNVMVTRKT